MNKNKFLPLIALMLTSSAFAGPLSVSTVTPVATTVGGYDMTGFVLPTPAGSTVQSAVSLDGDLVSFTGQNGAALPSTVMQIGNTANSGDAWWSGATDAFYFSSFDVSWVELVLPANTFAFSLTLDSSTNANAWIIGVDDAGNAIDTAGNQFSLNGDGSFDPTPAFNIQLRNGVAQSFGFYADNSTGSCNTLSKVVVDPHYWAMGDFSINVNDNQCPSVNVPEPGSSPMLMLGLLAVIGCRFRPRRVTRA